MSKLKTYVLMVSRTFPRTHPRSGESTGFVENISRLFIGSSRKIHTIRSNYPFWRKRAEEINSGRAVLSIRYWSGKPYGSKQIEILQLSRIGVEELAIRIGIEEPESPPNFVHASISGVKANWGDVADNDGLSFEDFCHWFNNVTPNESMAIIHFTDFRYQHTLKAWV